MGPLRSASARAPACGCGAGCARPGSGRTGHPRTDPIATADVYSAGESEEIVGKALKDRRDDVVLATKVFSPMGEDPNRRGLSRRWIVTEVEHSLRRLGTDYIDLYQVHRPDPNTDYDETLGALTDLAEQGKVRYIGSSSFSAGQIVEAQWTARDRSLQRVRTEQPSYSILVRGIELDVLPTAQRHAMGILTYSPLAGGWLSGSWTADSSPTASARQRLAARFDMSLPENQRKLEATEQLAKVADDAGLSLVELAIAFVVHHPAVTSAIIGPRTMEQLDSQLPAADVQLDAAVLDRVDEIVRPGRQPQSRRHQLRRAGPRPGPPQAVDVEPGDRRAFPSGGTSRVAGVPWRREPGRDGTHDTVHLLRVAAAHGGGCEWQAAGDTWEIAEASRGKVITGVRH